MRSIRRIFWHCAASKEGVDVKVEAIRRYHMQERKWNDIGYHYFIELDGAIRKGRPDEKPGAGVEGMNADSLHICYAGGLDANKKPKDTRTPAQRTALYSLTEKLLSEHPRATVHGHNEFAAKACPSFDVQKDWEEYKHVSDGPLLSPDITPGLKPEDMRDEDFDVEIDPGALRL